MEGGREGGVEGEKEGGHICGTKYTYWRGITQGKGRVWLSTGMYTSEPVYVHWYIIYMYLEPDLYYRYGYL